MMSSFLPYIDEPNKIYIIGDRKIGKSSLFRAFFNQPFIEKMQPSTIGIAKAALTYNGKNYTVKDLTDSDDYKCTKIFINEIEDVLCVIAIFSLTDKESFEKAKHLLTFAQSNITNNDDIQMILCGNKYDLIIDDSNNRAVQIEEIEEYVKSLHNCKYFDISCKTAYNVDKVIQVVNELEVQSNEDETEEVKEKEKKSCVIF